MAQHSLKWSSAPRALRERQLGVDKASVILGFIAGLPLGVGVVSESLAAAGAPDWLQITGLVLTVAATTVAGLRIGDWLAAHLRQS